MSLSTLPLTVFEREFGTSYYRVTRIVLQKFHGVSLFKNADNVNGELTLTAGRAELRVAVTGYLRIIGV